MLRSAAMPRKTSHPGVKLLKLQDGRHVARWVDPVTRRQKQQTLELIGKTTTKARVAWARQLSKTLQEQRASMLAGGEDRVVEEVTFEEAVELYLQGFTNENTIKNKQSPLRNLTEWMRARGHRSPLRVTGTILSHYADAVGGRQSPWKHGTQILFLSVARSFLGWAQDRGLALYCTGESLRRLKTRTAKSQDIEVLDLEAVRALLKAVIEHDRAGHPPISGLTLLTLLAGTRLGEGLGLQVADYKSDLQVLQLRNTKTKRPRVVDLGISPSLILLLDARKKQSPHGSVFGLERRVAQVSRERSMARFGAPAWNWVGLRRTCCSLLLSSDVIASDASQQVAWRLGHSVQVSERHYRQPLSGVDRSARTIEFAAGIQELATTIVTETKERLGVQ